MANLLALVPINILFFSLIDLYLNLIIYLYYLKNMNKKITILGIESSCDETAVSIVQEENETKILSNIVSSQFDIHKEFGVPELAARAHVEKIDLIAEKAISESKINLKDINAVAATASYVNSMFNCWIKFWKNNCCIIK